MFYQVGKGDAEKMENGQLMKHRKMDNISFQFCVHVRLVGRSAVAL